MLLIGYCNMLLVYQLATTWEHSNQDLILCVKTGEIHVFFGPSWVLITTSTVVAHMPSRNSATYCCARLYSSGDGHDEEISVLHAIPDI